MTSRSYETILFGELPDLPGAACISTNPDIFFPFRDAYSYDARNICRTCPEQNACLTWALEHPGVSGIWGGLSDTQRRRMRVAS